MESLALQASMHAERVISCAFLSQDTIATQTIGQAPRLWRLLSGSEPLLLKPQPRFPAACVLCRFSEDGTVVAMHIGYDQVGVFSSVTGKLIRRIEPQQLVSHLAIHRGDFVALALKDDRKVKDYTMKQAVELWNLRTGARWRRIEVDQD